MLVLEEIDNSPDRERGVVKLQRQYLSNSVFVFGQWILIPSCSGILRLTFGADGAKILVRTGELLHTVQAVGLACQEADVVLADTNMDRRVHIEGMAEGLQIIKG